MPQVRPDADVQANLQIVRGPAGRPGVEAQPTARSGQQNSDPIPATDPTGSDSTRGRIPEGVFQG